MTLLRLIQTLLLLALLIFFWVGEKAKALDFGQDYLGIKHRKFDCNMAISLLPEGQSIGALIDDSFGDSNQCLERIIAERKPKLARLHLLNGACIRGKYCVAGSEAAGFTVSSLEQQSTDARSKLYQILSPKIAYIKQLRDRFPNTMFMISPILEHDLSVNGARSLYQNVQRLAPGFMIVDNTMKNDESPSGSYRERHRKEKGDEVVATVTSHDGVNAEDTNIERWKKLNEGNILALVWTQSFNCRNKPCKRGTGITVNGRKIECVTAFVNPRDRKYCPTRNQFGLGIRVTYPEQSKPIQRPSACGNVRNLLPNEIWKLAADDHRTDSNSHTKNNDSKANKPVFITPVTRGELLVRSPNGSVIDKMPKYGAFSGGTVRYYANLDAFELGQRLEINSGSEWLYMDMGNNTCILLNAYRRAGAFR